MLETYLDQVNVFLCNFVCIGPLSALLRQRKGKEYIFFLPNSLYFLFYLIIFISLTTESKFSVNRTTLIFFFFYFDFHHHFPPAPNLVLAYIRWSIVIFK